MGACHDEIQIGMSILFQSLFLSLNAGINYRYQGMKFLSIFLFRGSALGVRRASAFGCGAVGLVKSLKSIAKRIKHAVLQQGNIVLSYIQLILR